ncbi:hypothetical protein INR49_022215 [Caranx melampygus]|nr:hypothetical protein INR49_022215 [Caranx melampygus]
MRITCEAAARLSEMDGGEEVQVEAAPYCCSTCDGGEVSGRRLARRNRKTRSLSTSSAGSSSEYRRTQSLHGPSPVTTFGPKACMLQNPHAVILTVGQSASIESSQWIYQSSSSSSSSVSFFCLSKTHLSNKENPFPEMGVSH